MYPRIVRQIAPMGETALSNAAEAASDCCKCICEFIGWQIFDYLNVETGLAPSRLASSRALRETRQAASLRNTRGNAVSPHIRLQCFRNTHAAVSLLIVLDDRNPCASYRQAAAIQCMQKLRLALALWTITNIRSPRLKAFKIRTRRNLSKQILPRQPDFDVISLGRGESDISGAQRHHTVVQAEFLQNGLGVVGELFEFFVSRLGARELHQFH